MNRLTGILIGCVVVELVIGAWLVNAARHEFDLPLPSTINDPLVAAELDALAATAKSGGSLEWQQLGEALLGQGFYSHSEHAFRFALELGPGNSQALYGLAFSLDRTGRLDDSLAAWQSLVDSGDTSLMRQQARYMVGMNLLRLNRADQAEKAFRDNPGFPAAQYQLARLLIRAGQHEDGLKIVDRQLHKLPDSLGFHWLSFRALKSLARDSEADAAADELDRAQIRMAVNLSTDYVRPLRQRLGLARLQEEYNLIVPTQEPKLLDDSLQKLTTAIGDRTVPEAITTAISRAEVAFLRRDPEEILRALQLCDDLGVTSSDVLVLQAVAHQKLGQRDRAVELLTRILNLGPNLIAHQSLADDFDRRGLAHERDRHLSLRSTHEGIALYRSRQDDAAADQLSEAVDLDATNALAWFYLGETRHAQGQTPDALEAWLQCRELDAGHGRVRRRIQSMAGQSVRP